MTDNPVERMARAQQQGWDAAIARVKKAGGHVVAGIAERTQDRCETCGALVFDNAPEAEPHCLPCMAALNHPQPGPNDAWQPIETAPKDGTEFLAWVHTAAGGRVATVQWLDGQWVESYDLAGWMPEYGPTHWRPLPDPPALSSLQGKLG